MLAHTRGIIAEPNYITAEVTGGWGPALAGAAVADEPEGQDVGGRAVQGHRTQPSSYRPLWAQDAERHRRVRWRPSSEDNSKNHPQLRASPSLSIE